MSDALYFAIIVPLWMLAVASWIPTGWIDRFIHTRAGVVVDKTWQFIKSCVYRVTATRPTN